MGKEIINLENIVKNYKVGTVVVEALRSISLVIRKNEFVRFRFWHDLGAGR